MKKHVTMGVMMWAIALAGADARAQENGASMPVAGYDGGFFIQSEDGDNKLKVQGRIQGRFQWERDATENSFAFSIPRLRLKLSGHAFSKKIEYMLHLDFGKGFASLKDGFVNLKPLDWLHVQMGQFKRPFSRHELTSSSKLHFVDRALTAKAFDTGRDIGLMAHNGGKSTFEWALGLFNGTGDKATFVGTTAVDPDPPGDGEDPDDGFLEGTVSGKFVNVPDSFEPMVVLRLGYNPKDAKGYSSGDFKGGPLRISAAAAGLFKINEALDDLDVARAEVDAILKVEGFTALIEGLYQYEKAPDASSFGVDVELSYVIDGMFLPAARYAGVFSDDGSRDHEILGGFSVHFVTHNVKLDLDGGALLSEASDGTRTTDIQVRTQIQLSF